MKVLDNQERLTKVFDDQNLAVIDNVLIFNHHLVHPVMLEAFEFMLKTERNHNLSAIFISPDKLTDRLGEYNEVTRSFIISLPKILEHTLETEGEKQGLSLVTGVWTNMIHVFLHELRHNVCLAINTITSANPDTPDYQDELEQDADEYATILLEQLAAGKKIEMPPLADIPWFNTQVMQVLVDEIAAGEKEWAGAHKKLIDQELVFSDGKDFYTSIYDYFWATTEQPELYGSGVALQMVEEEVTVPTNVFDQELLPGEQMSMFKNNSATLAELEANPDGSVTTITDPAGDHAQGMRERGATEEDIQRGMRNAAAMPMSVPEGVDQDMLEMMDVESEDVGDANYGDVVVEDEPVQAAPVSAAPMPAPAAPAPVATPAAPAVAPATSNAALAMCHAVYTRLANHMFAACGHLTDGTFANPAAIAINPMPLSGEEIGSGLFATSYTINMVEMNAVWDDVSKCGGIRGRTFKNGSLPGYDLVINWFGKECRVRLVAQNSTKTSAVAAKARAGAKIVWLINQDDTTGNPFIGSWENGVYTPCRR